jgi:MEDS: MEthanogen/methylotroph, DcmR Sensory domain/Histidine kinase-like ATPase domain
VQRGTVTHHRTALRHNALVYESDDEYLARAVPFLKEGIAAGEGAVVAHTKPGIAMMREAMGDDAAAVTFVDVGAAYTRPARTLAAYHEVYAEQLARSPALRAVADVQFGPEPAEWDLWTGYEGVFNTSFRHLPAWVLCSYNANGTPDPIIDGVWATHPEVLVAGGAWHASSRYEAPRQLLRRIGPSPAPVPGLRAIPPTDDLELLRERVAAELPDRMAPARRLDALLAVTEVARNAVVHGGGVHRVRVGCDGGRFVCEIIDRGGGFDDPEAGYLAPRSGQGSGLWVARQLAWQIDFCSSSDGFTARVRL